MPVSAAWPVAAERIQDRETVGGGQWRAGNRPPGGKAQRAQQSLGRTSGSAEEPAERHPEAPSLSPTLEERHPEGHPEDRHPEEAPSCSPHPRRCPWAGFGVAPTPLTKTVRFRLVSGTHVLFHLSD